MALGGREKKREIQQSAATESGRQAALTHKIKGELCPFKKVRRKWQVASAYSAHGKVRSISRGRLKP